MRRYRRGYKNVIAKGVELNKQGTRVELMMETRWGSPPWLVTCAGPCSFIFAAPCGHSRLLPELRSAARWTFVHHRTVIQCHWYWNHSRQMFWNSYTMLAARRCLHARAWVLDAPACA